MTRTQEDDFPYNDIISLPAHKSKCRPPMPLDNRAAQFSPFAALIGHGDIIQETARLTEPKIDLEEDATARLDEKLRVIAHSLLGQSEIIVTYFVADPRKNGGAYYTEKGIPVKIKEFEKLLIMEGGNVIPIHDIIAIDLLPD